MSNFVYAHNDHYIVTRMLTYVCEYKSTQQFETLIYIGKINFNSVF